MRPRITRHARERCAEMGVGTERAVRVVLAPSVTRPAGDGRLMAVSDIDPDIAVVYAPGEMPAIITVVWRTVEKYRRTRGGYVVEKI